MNFIRDAVMSPRFPFFFSLSDLNSILVNLRPLLPAKVLKTSPVGVFTDCL